MQTSDTTGSLRRILLRGLSILILTAMVVGYAVLLYRHDHRETMSREVVSLTSYTREVCENLQRKGGFLFAYKHSAGERYLVRMEMAMVTARHLSDGAIDTLKVNGTLKGSPMDFYALNERGEVIESEASRPLELSGEQMKELLEKGQLVEKRRAYMLGNDDGDLYVTAFDTNDVDLDSLDFSLSTVVSYIVRNADGEIVADSEDEEAKAFENITAEELKKAELLSEKEMPVYRVKLGRKAYLAASQAVTVRNAPLTVFTFIESGWADKTAWFSALFCAALMLLYTGICVVIVMRLGKKYALKDEPQETDSQNRRKHHSQRYYLVTALLKVASAVIVTSVLLYSIHILMGVNSEVNQALDNLYTLKDSYRHNQEHVNITVDKVGEEFLDDVTRYLCYINEDDTETWLSEIAPLMDVDEITVFNGEGKSVISTTPYKGYRLGENAATGEYRLWDILKGGVRKMTFYSEEEGTAYFAMRRQDDVGIVMMKSYGEEAQLLLKALSISDLLRVRDYENVQKMFSMREQPDKLFIIVSDSADPKIADFTIPMPAVGETLTGIRKIYDRNYLFIDIGTGEGATVFAYPLVELTDDVLRIAALCTGNCIAIALFTILTLAKKETVTLAVTRVSVAIDAFATEKKRLLRHSFSALAVLIAVILLFRNVLFDRTLMIIDFFNSWESGVNIITISFIVLATFITVGIILLVNIVTDVLQKLVQPKAATVIMMLSSIFKVLMIVTLTIGALEQLGVNAVAIMTGLGLTGLALGIGAKDTISDLVAGIFIIFEGQIHLGDYIEIGSFSGTVTALGIRTTKVQYRNQEMIINNSGLKNVLNHSRGVGRVTVYAVVSQDTDLEIIKNAVAAAKDRFITACGGSLLDGLRMDGISDFKDYGVECRFVAPVMSDRQAICTLICRTMLKQVLDENGIRLAEKMIPFPENIDQKKSSEEK